MSQLSAAYAAAFAINVWIFGCYGAQWGEQFISCHGKFQYPIHMDRNAKITEKEFTDFKVKGFNVPATGAELKNNGQTMLINLKYTEIPTIEGGALEGKGVYNFSHLQFHWFDTKSLSSHYRSLNISYPIELHIVFFNQKYASANEAQIFLNGIAVLAFNLKIDDNDGFEAFEELVGLVDRVHQPNNSASFVNPLQLKNIMDKYIYSYTAYIGTMLTPPCSKDVIWIDFENRIALSVQQYSALDKFGDNWSMRKNPNLREVVYSRKLARLKMGPGGAIPLSYARNKANKYSHIAVIFWMLLLLMFGFF